MQRVQICRDGSLFADGKFYVKWANARTAFTWLSTHFRVHAFNTRDSGDIHAWVGEAR